MNISFKRILVIIIPVFLITLVVLFVINQRYGQSTFGDDFLNKIIGLDNYVSLNKADLSINKTFPDPPCQDCTIGVKATEEFEKLEGKRDWCLNDNDCAVISYDGNPYTSCGPTYIPLSQKRQKAVSLDMDKYFQAFEASRPGIACGAPLTQVVGIKCFIGQCRLVERGAL